MGMKKRNKINAEFSMSSLTDIIFLLLIFFMLTSKVVNVDDVDLPEGNSQTVTDLEVSVTLKKDNTYYIRDNKVPISKLKGALELELRKVENPDRTKIGIAAEKGTSFNNVMKVIKVAHQLKKDAIILTKPTEPEG